MTIEESTENMTLADMPFLVRFSDKVGRFAESLGKLATLLFLPLVLLTVWDVFQRKVLKYFGDYLLANGYTDFRNEMYDVLLKILPFQSTILQEMEWHFHAALVALVLGYGYAYNRHVRVDLVRETLSFRKQAWIEFLGCTFFMVPFCLLIVWFAGDYAYEAFTSNEQSASLVGLHYRWIIKSIFMFGLIIAALTGIAVWIQTALVLFGPKELRFELMTLERPEEKIDRRLSIDVTERQSLSDRQKLAGS